MRPSRSRRPGAAQTVWRRDLAASACLSTVPKKKGAMSGVEVGTVQKPTYNGSIAGVTEGCIDSYELRGRDLIWSLRGSIVTLERNRLRCQRPESSLCVARLLRRAWTPGTAIL
ncbi:hypothetical protein MRX96_057236 [Rhipicephalus microplus]